MSILYNTNVINSINVTTTISNTITTTTNTILMCPSLYNKQDTPTQKYVSKLVCNKLKFPTTWDDITVDLTKVGSNIPSGPSTPTFDQIGTTSLYAYNLNAINKYIYFTTQIPHKWLIGSEMRPHLHCIPVYTTGASIQLALNITILNYKDDSSSQIFIKNILTYVNDSPTSSATEQSKNIDGNFTLENGAQCVIPFDPITISDLSGKDISSIIICRLSSESLSNINNLYVLSFDFHYQSNYLGSTEEYSQ